MWVSKKVLISDFKEIIFCYSSIKIVTGACNAQSTTKSVADCVYEERRQALTWQVTPMLFLSSQDLVFVPCSESINHAWCNSLLNIRLRGSVDAACSRNKDDGRACGRWSEEEEEVTDYTWLQSAETGDGSPAYRTHRYTQNVYISTILLNV